MSALNDKEILSLIEGGNLIITPLIQNNVQPGSVDLTLHNKIEVFHSPEILDIAGIQKDALSSMEEIVDISDGYSLKPGEFITGRSEEYIELPQNILAIITNRNSLAKIGIDAAISTFTNPGFKGRKTIVIKNNSQSVIVLRPGMRICQMLIFKMDSASARSYENRHDESAITSAYDTKILPGLKQNVQNIDDSLSALLRESITKAAASILVESISRKMNDETK